MELDLNRDMNEMEEGSEPVVICPVCGQAVNNHAAEELYTVDFVESDFRVRTLDDDILDTWLVFCHHCLYITHDFRYIPDQISSVRECVSTADYRSRFTDTNPTTLELFEHYVYLLENLKAPAMVFADTYLRMSWLYDDDQNDGMANRYREKAIVHYAKALLTGGLSEKDVSMIYYYIAELSRRNGDFDRARRSLLKMDTEIPMFRRLFDFQLLLIRDHNDGAAIMPREVNQHDDQLS
ncbi:MAG: DUF2225 domain-containing protein [FCB group bacterium]|nr:DUF2225 domain-containing protein [FCB group bacterium]